jgi:hypothetical protein
MSRYAYGYSVVPARPRGWGSSLGNFVGVSAVVLLSGISGAVVAFNLIGGDARVVPTPVSMAAVAPARVDVAQAPIQAPVKLPTKVATQASAAPSIPPIAPAAAEKQKPAQRAEAPAVAAPVTVAPPQLAPAQLSHTDDAAISSGDLTFAKGYALRRAARQAAAAQAQKPTAAPNAKVAAAGEQPGAAAETQFGRPAVVKRKPSVVAQYPRGDRYSFERFDGPTRHQALAYGDSSRPVRRMNQGGWFDGLF